MRALVRRLVLEEDGQDLIEYALLATLVAIVGIAALNQLQSTLHDAYVQWDSANQALWEMPDPSGL
jgi:Flp pilus assembly pilin Flp